MSDISVIVGRTKLQNHHDYPLPHPHQLPTKENENAVIQTVVIQLVRTIIRTVIRLQEGYNITKIKLLLHSQHSQARMNTMEKVSLNSLTNKTLQECFPEDKKKKNDQGLNKGWSKAKPGTWGEQSSPNRLKPHAVLQ